MKTGKRHLSGAALLCTAAFAVHAQGQGGPGAPDAFSYRCHILGEAAACWIREESLRGAPIPGPYAACLVGQGAGREQALAAAATLGEYPKPAPRNRSGAKTATQSVAPSSNRSE